jgi:SAM-dependent methyltransferase
LWKSWQSLLAQPVRRHGAGPAAKELISLRPRSNKLVVLPVLSAFRLLQRLVKSYLGIDALDRVSRYIYDGAYGLPQWREISTFNYGYAPSDDSVAELWPNEPHQIQLYAEVAKAIREAGGRTAPSRLLEVCCGRGGGLAHLHATLSPEATIGIDRSLAAIRHGRNGNAAIAHLQGHALQLPLPEASVDLAVNVEALADVPKLPFLAEICRVLTTNGIFAVADTMPHSPEACCLGLVGLGQQTGLTVVNFRDITVNVCEACRNDDRRRSELVNRLPRYLRPLAREWVSLPGSTRFAQFERKERCYFIATMVKDTALSAAAG